MQLKLSHYPNTEAVITADVYNTFSQRCYVDPQLSPHITSTFGERGEYGASHSNKLPEYTDALDRNPHPATTCCASQPENGI